MPQAPGDHSGCAWKGEQGAEGRAVPSWSQIPAQVHGAHTAQEHEWARARGALRAPSLRMPLTPAREAPPEGPAWPSVLELTGGIVSLGRDTAAPMLNGISASL